MPSSTKTTDHLFFWTLSLAILFLPLLFILIQVLSHTHGVFAYPLDDTYIHLAVARNLVQHHVWGVAGDEFASASSSVLYPLVLAAAFMVTGIQTIMPFLVNLLAAIAFLYSLKRWMDRQALSPAHQLIVMISTILLTPLPTIVLVGMEHTLHLLFFFLFVTGISECIGQKSRVPWTIYLWAALMTATRFEGIPMIGMAALVLLFTRKTKEAFFLAFIGLLPVVLYGIVSVRHGGFFFPNAVVLKPALPPFNFDALSQYVSNQLIPRLFTNSERFTSLGVQRLLIILPLLFVLFRKKFPGNSDSPYLLGLLMGATIFHVVLAAYSFYLRYEVYLSGTAIPVCLTLFLKYRSPWVKSESPIVRPAAIVLGIFLLCPFPLRSWNAFSQMTIGSIWTHDQQVQMGQFIHEYYDNTGVIFNDIGAVSYYSEGKKLDILGLGNNDVAHFRHDHLNSPLLQDSLVKDKNVRIGVIYEPRFRSFADGWKKVASWDIPFDNPIQFYDSVSWYAVDTVEAGRLRNNLKRYQSKLPEEIVVRYY